MYASLNGRIDRIEARMDRIETRLDRIEADLTSVKNACRASKAGLPGAFVKKRPRPHEPAKAVDPGPRRLWLRCRAITHLRPTQDLTAALSGKIRPTALSQGLRRY